MSDLCNQFGFQDRFFDRLGGYDDLAEFGLFLNVPRLQSVAGSQFYKALFYIHIKRGFYIDDLFADALSVYYEEKQRTASRFERDFKEAVEAQRRSYRNQ